MITLKHQKLLFKIEEMRILIEAIQKSPRGFKMANLFDQYRNYLLGDPELKLIGDRDKLAQWRHKNTGPAYYKLGRKIIYRGVDLNDWANANRTDPNEGAV